MRRNRDKRSAFPICLAAFLRSGFAKSYFLRCSKQTTNLASINMTQLRATPIPIPPLPLQQKFAGLESLKAQIALDAAEARRMLAGARPDPAASGAWH